MTKLNSANFEVPEKAWSQAATGVPVSDAFTNADGAWRLVLTGIWSTAKREYEYASLEVAGYTLAQAAQLGVAKRLLTAGPADVEHYRDEADTAWDEQYGGLTHTTGKHSRLAAWAVRADAPGHLKYSTLYRSSRGVPHGAKRALWLGSDVETASQYRRAASAYRAARDLPEPLPRDAVAGIAPPTDKQLVVLQRAVEQPRGRWGYPGHPPSRMPRSAKGASMIINALAANRWQPCRAVDEAWDMAIRGEMARGLWPPPKTAEVQRPAEIIEEVEDEIEIP